MSMERVAILGGTGALGHGLALRLAIAGYDVVIGSRDAERAEESAAKARAIVGEQHIVGMSNADAVAHADRLVVVAVPFASQASTLSSVSEHLREGQVVLDVTVPLGPAIGGKATQLIGVWQGSAAQQARSIVPAHVGVASGLHTISAAGLCAVDQPMQEDTFIFGDKASKAVVTEIISVIAGLGVIDGGLLAMSRLGEALTPLLIGVNIRYKTHAGIRITGLGAEEH